jgi:hypothetical protein
MGAKLPHRLAKTRHPATSAEASNVLRDADVGQRSGER